MLGNDRAVDTAASLPVCCDPHPKWIACRNQIVEDLICYSFIEDAALTIVEIVILQGFEFDARFVWDVLNSDRSKVGKARLGAYRGELRVNMCNRKPASRSRIRECLKIHEAKIRA